MRAGRLNRRLIDIERKTITVVPPGDTVETWTKISARRSAGYRVLSGDERFTADQFIAKQQVEFLVRKSSAISDLNPLDRIIYPPDASSPANPPEHQIYDIMSVDENETGNSFRIKTARRTENPNA